MEGASKDIRRSCQTGSVFVEMSDTNLGREKFVPGDLYRFQDHSEPWSIQVNGKPCQPEVKNGFAVLDRTWTKGDTVQLDLPMKVRVSECNEKVDANRNRVAISRGPIIFSAEGIDNGGSVERFFFSKDLRGSKFKVTNATQGALAGLPQIQVPAKELKSLEKVTDTTVRLIPYFAWSNRDRSSMTTWLPVSRSLAKVDRYSKDQLKYQQVTASHTFQGDTVEAIRRRYEPKSSFDRTIRRWTSWPQKGKTQWVDVVFKKERSIESVGLYFYDDKGGVQVPGRWWIEVPNGKNGSSNRLEIYNTDQYSCLKDAYNTVHPKEKLVAKKIRIVMEPQHQQTCVGILSLDVLFQKESKDTKTQVDDQADRRGRKKELKVGRCFFCPIFLGMAKREFT